MALLPLREEPDRDCGGHDRDEGERGVHREQDERRKQKEDHIDQRNDLDAGFLFAVAGGAA